MKQILRKILGPGLTLALAVLLATTAWATDPTGGKPDEIPMGMEDKTWWALDVDSGSADLDDGCYYLTDDTVLIGKNLTIADEAEVTIHLNGHQLKGMENYTGYKGSVITVGYDATLNLYDNQANAGTITGGVGTYNSGGGVYVNGTFVMHGGTITGNTVNDQGGGVYVYGNASFTMNDGSITNNTAVTQHGGGVYVQENATFTMNGGSITNNKVRQHGGGVYVNKANFTMTEGEISYNTADGEGNTSDGNGGGIYLNSAKSVTVSNADEGKIIFSHNQARNGGGIYITNEEDDGLDAITMDNITVTDNKTIYSGTVANTDSNGGGIYVTALDEFTLTNSTIQNNTADDNGGGVYIEVDTVTLTNNEITDNKSTAESGGGVFTTGSVNHIDGNETYIGTLVMTNNSISNNTAGIAGGGGYIENYETATLSGNTISGNAANDAEIYGKGGGLYVLAEDLYLTGDKITNNSSQYQGGGLYHDSAKLFVSGTVTITGNTAFGGTTNNVTTAMNKVDDRGYSSVTGTLNPASRIGFTQPKTTGENHLFMNLEEGASANLESFFSDSESYTVKEKTDGEKTIGYYFDFANKEDLFAGGEGTAENPYQIATAEHLQTLGKFWENEALNASDKYYSLTDDIVLDRDYVFFHMFAHLDGNGKTISGAPTTGVFNIVTNVATLKNLKLNFTSENIESADYFGCLAHQTQSGAIIENCHNFSDITIPSDKAINHAGGLVGLHQGRMINCSNAGNLSSPYSVGGLVGVLFDIGKVEKCYNTGNVSGSVIAGGIVGENKGCSISNCYNVGKISGEGIVGGVIGSNKESSSTITSVYNSGTLSGGTTVGGVVGSDDGTGTFTNCYYVGEEDSAQKGTALTRDQVTGDAAKTYMTGFDFDSVWYVNPFGTPLLTEPPIASIAVDTAPGKTTYNPGQTFDPTGLVIEISNDSGETALISYADNEDSFTFDLDLEQAFTADDIGDITVTITYKNDKNTTQTISVSKPSSGGGGSITKPTTTTKPTTEDVTKPDGTTATTTTATVTPTVSNGHDTTSSTVKDKDIDTAIAQALDSKDDDHVTQVEIKVESKKDTPKVEVSLTTDALTTVADSDVDDLTITTDIGAITVSSETAKAIADQADGKDITITVEQVDSAVLTREQKTAVGDAQVYDLHITSNGEPITTFGGHSVTVTLPYALAEGESADHIVIWYLADDGTMEALEGCYDAETGKAVFATAHLSYYVALHSNNPFEDAAVEDYYFSPVMWAVENGITQGTTATTFSPDMTCSRAQAVTFLWNAAGKPQVESENPFTDVNQDDWYYHAVLWAVSEGITQGTSETTFSPDAECTRSQIVTFLWNAEQKPVVNYLMTFEDVAEGTWYTEAVRWAVSEGITSGTSATTFTPDKDCTRAEIVTFLYRALANETD